MLPKVGMYPRGYCREDCSGQESRLLACQEKSHNEVHNVNGLQGMGWGAHRHRRPPFMCVGESCGWSAVCRGCVARRKTACTPVPPSSPAQ